MMRWLFGRKSPRGEFERRRPELVQAWFEQAARSGSPRGLIWQSWIENGQTEFAKDARDGQILALVPVVVQFETVSGGALEDVPQACEPRAVVAVFRWVRRAWLPDGRALFNLTPSQVIERSAGRWAKD